MDDFSVMTVERLLRSEGWLCACGRRHQAGLQYLKVERGAVRRLPEALSRLGKKRPFIVCDSCTRAAAWASVKAALDGAGVDYQLYEFPMARVEPDEYALGCLAMSFDRRCDVILAMGSGVINDCCKVLGQATGVPTVAVCTAPSMDGYASNCASMIRSRVKVALYTPCPAAIIADTEIMAQAPRRMLWAGLGDMLAKYVALCEWRISHLITGEYYCANVAGLMRESLRRIGAAAPRLMERDPDVIGEVANGLVLSGVAMVFAGVSRPASGQEHYFSHLWEMMALDRGTPCELHGIQVGVGTLLTLKLYDTLRLTRPSREKAEAFLKGFSEAQWEKNVRRVFGQAAQPVLDLAKSQRKNDPTAHRRRMERILAHWDDILQIISEELPPTEAIEALMKRLGMPLTPNDIGVDRQDTRDALDGSRDIRDKYLTSTMLWDIGMLYDFPLP